jgi:signal transduction histidine kinase
VVSAAAAVTLRSVSGRGRLGGLRPTLALSAAAGAAGGVALGATSPAVTAGGLAAAAVLSGGSWVLVGVALCRRVRSGACTVASPRTMAAIALAVGGLTAARALIVLAPGTRAALSVLLDLGLLAVAAVAASTVLRRISDALTGQERYVAALLEQLAGHEGQLQQARACLHDARAAAAGVRACSSAVRHLTAPDDAPLRADLEESVHAEIGRLERMLRLPDRRPRVSTVDLDALVRPLVVSHRERGLRVDWAPSGGAPVTVDGDALVVVLGNLLGNALAHAPGSLCRVEVTVTDVLVVTVSDDGPGVDPATRPRVYEAGTSRPGSAGEGLGLAISRDLARRAGGDLTEVGGDGGACFVLTLPRRAGAPAPRPETAAPAVRAPLTAAR